MLGYTVNRYGVSVRKYKNINSSANERGKGYAQNIIKPLRNSRFAKRIGWGKPLRQSLKIRAIFAVITVFTAVMLMETAVLAETYKFTVLPSNITHPDKNMVNILKYASGTITLTAKQLDAADIYEDGKVDTLDAINLLKKI